MQKLLIALGVLGLALGVARADALVIHGAGATFPFPLYSKWFSEYGKLHPDQRFNYQSVGSGAGIRQISERTVDFGASDAPMTDAELKKAPGLLHLPMVVGAVAVVYSGAPDGIRLTPDVLADLFLGKITTWSDPRVQAANPGLKLPDAPVTVVHRSDGSGTTAVFTDYLAKVSPAWKQAVGAAKSVRWPVGIGGKGNEGVTAIVKTTPGALGYVELAYARQARLATAAVRNADGQFVVPSVEATSLAAAGVSLPGDLRGSITDAKGKGAYPIAALTYLLVYREQADARKGRALGPFLWWAVHDGQKLAPPLDYAPLPPAVVAQVEAAIRGVSAEGKSVAP